MTHSIFRPISRRFFIKTSALGSLGLASALSLPALSQNTAKMTGQLAPELEVPHWIDGKGNESKAFSVAEQRGKWVYLKCFQQWCPACHSVGFPNLQKLVDAFPTDEHVAKAVIQTAFEGIGFNTTDALRKNQLHYELELPFGHDEGDTKLPRKDPGHYPKTMLSYQTRGTPWVVLINPEGEIVFNHFQIDMDRLIPYLKQQINSNF